MDKVQEILLNNNIDIPNTRFSCLDGTNAMSGEHTGLQRRIHNLAPFQFMLTVDVIDWLYVSSICLVSFPGLNQLLLFRKKLQHFKISSRSIWYKSTQYCESCGY